jgi:hypothetical protein
MPPIFSTNTRHLTQLPTNTQPARSVSNGQTRGAEPANRLEDILNSVAAGHPAPAAPVSVPTAAALQTPASTRTPAPVAKPRFGPSVLGRSLARLATANARLRNTVGNCYASVADAVDAAVGRFLYGMSAYMAAGQLAKHPRFEEVRVNGQQLRELPAGAVVVWGKTAASPDGHISIALGDGREASDHIDVQRLSLRGDSQPRVFLPR